MCYTDIKEPSVAQKKKVRYAMTPETKEKLEYLNNTLDLIEKYYHACSVVSYDM